MDVNGRGRFQSTLRLFCSYAKLRGSSVRGRVQLPLCDFICTCELQLPRPARRHVGANPSGHAQVASYSGNAGTFAMCKQQQRFQGQTWWCDGSTVCRVRDDVRLVPAYIRLIPGGAVGRLLLPGVARSFLQQRLACSSLVLAPHSADCVLHSGIIKECFTSRARCCDNTALADTLLIPKLAS